MNDRYGNGIDLVTRMMGPQFAAGLEASAQSGGFAADLATMAIETAFGSAWARPGMSLRDRSLVVISSLIAQRQFEELKNHVRIGLDNGLTPLELQEVLIQSVPYVGFPAVSSAVLVMIEVLRERGLDGAVKSAKDHGIL